MYVLGQEVPLAAAPAQYQAYWGSEDCITHTHPHIHTYSRRSYSMSPATRNYSLAPTTRAGTCTHSRTSQTRHSYTRDCTTRLSCSPLSRLPTREHSTATKQKTGVSPGECLNATLPPFNKEQTLPIYHKNSANLPQEQTLPIYRTFNSPVDHFQPFLKIDYLLGSMKSVLNPVYVQPI